ncbi:hypothetical protein Nepgr_023033 [Nepenthes gracilis]|uniref:Uncharacterized protein n=1 Tax=Nepenthes gracilis TaxID=150966 RepID=A0AAD3T203_NEPGR|nr:hypothetical protein Nepgr_023033 [Nepenthes gracilis]
MGTTAEKNQLTPFMPKSGGINSGPDPPKQWYRSSTSPCLIFNQDHCRHEISKMIIMHDYPLHMVEHPGFFAFVQNLLPRFDKSTPADGPPSGSFMEGSSMVVCEVVPTSVVIHNDHAVLVMDDPCVGDHAAGSITRPITILDVATFDEGSKAAHQPSLSSDFLSNQNEGSPGVIPSKEYCVSHGVDDSTPESIVRIVRKYSLDDVPPLVRIKDTLEVSLLDKKSLDNQEDLSSVPLSRCPDVDSEVKVAESLHSIDVGRGKVHAMHTGDPDADVVVSAVSPANLALKDGKEVQRCLDIPLPCCSQAARAPVGSPSRGWGWLGKQECRVNLVFFVVSEGSSRRTVNRRAYAASSFDSAWCLWEVAPGWFMSGLGWLFAPSRSWSRSALAGVFVFGRRPYRFFKLADAFMLLHVMVFSDAKVSSLADACPVLWGVVGELFGPPSLGQFIDNNRKLHRQLVNVVMEPFTETDMALSHAAATCLSYWNLEKKLSSITANQPLKDAGVENLRALLSGKNSQIFNGQLLIRNCSSCFE